MDGERRPIRRSEVRVGDADRKAVVDELQKHFVDGRLSSEELGERVAQALSAKTFGELEVPLADLPDLNPAPIPTPDGPLPSHYHHSMGLADGRILGLVLLVVAVVALSFLFFGSNMHFGIAPIWPIFIWGFFIFGRPHHGGRRRY
jgi:hypothetical protein